MLPRATHTRSDREAARGKQSGRTQEIQRLIGRSLRAVFDLTLLGERTIPLDCDVLQADGGTRTAAITGAFVAAARRGELAAGRRARSQRSPIRDAVAAVSVGIVARHAAARPRIRRGLGLRHRHERRHDRRRAASSRCRARPRARPSRAPRWTRCCALAEQGHRRAGRGAAPGARHRLGLTGDAAMRLVLASNNPGKLAELQALFAPLGIELVRAGRARHRRGRGAARHLRRERAGQGAPRGAAQRPARRSPTTPACASTRSAALPGVASAHFAPLRQLRRPRSERRPRTTPTTRCCSSSLQGRADRRARFVSTLVARAPRRRSRAADRRRPLAGRDRARAARQRRLRLRPADLHPGARQDRRRADAASQERRTAIARLAARQMLRADARRLEPRLR